jgi:hypothetical protein
MTELSRRAFVSRAIAVGASSGMLGEAAHGQLVWTKAAWKVEDFQALVHKSRRIKQVFDASTINGGRFLNNVRNSMNGLHFGSSVPMEQIQLVCAMRGTANMMNYDDYAWQKYRLGEWTKVEDPKTGKPATRNIFFPSRAGAPGRYASDDPSSEDSVYQDASMQALQGRGVRFLSCHSSTEEQVRGFAKEFALTQDREEIVKDMLAHTVPGVLVVASAAAALAILQCEGHYSYMAV